MILNFDQLKNFLIDKAEVDDKKAKMRAQQMFNAVYKKTLKVLMNLQLLV